MRETLCEMQLPYLYRNCARGSPKRQEMQQELGLFQVRYCSAFCICNYDLYYCVSNCAVLAVPEVVLGSSVVPHGIG